ncbi:beta/gamma crystallin-related protein [Maribacter sp. 2307ULW6-5]|uniref:beta/gamma crystallin-related protein n=1 Tax=Maribacter sp. 2307ULW6-5 TaxID=3386275 RepID=UPI0039BD77A4
MIYFQPGLDAVEAIDPFMDGNLPNIEPSSDIDLVEIHTDIPWESPQAVLPFPGTDKLLVVEMDGRFFTVPDNDDATEAERTMVMDIQDRCWYYSWTGNVGQKHGGFQNVAFHPNFGQGLGKDYIYVYYLHKKENEETDFEPPYYDRLSRFSWNGTNFDPGSELIMINQYDTHKGHDGSGLAFGADGFLYVSVGDEGSFGDAILHTQTLNDRFRSGVWRIDVDMQGGGISHPIQRQPSNANTPPNAEQSYTQGYYIPSDNPWVTGTGAHLEEFYAIGLRQPFRMTYDPPTGNFWIGDVGEAKFEEVNIMDKPALNFQWNYKEGFAEGGRNFIDYPNPIIGEERVPLYAYDGSVGSAVIGGYVYRGSEIPELYGKYIYGDNANGLVFALTHTGGNTNGGVETIGNIGGSVFNGISSFGYDHDNELMVLKLSNGVPGGGKIFKLVKKGLNNNLPMPALLSETGVFSDLQNLTPAAGVMPYDVNTPLWSSGTEKYRWVSLPQDGLVDSVGEQIGYNEEDDWTFPIGTTFIKQFNNPDGTKLETRLWIHGTDGEWFGSTYKWRPNGMEADLLLLGTNEVITIDGDTFGYEYPAANTCIQCHNPIAGWVLGFNTRQLNKDMLYPSTGRTANQLETLASLGFIPPVDTNTVPTLVRIDDNNEPLETRVRSYFDSNCASCHLPGNTRAGFDMRFSQELPQQALINGSIIEDLTGSGKAIVPGDASKSNVHYRLNSLDPSAMMPPLAKGRIDIEAVHLLEAWINSLDDGCENGNASLLGFNNLGNGDFLDVHSPHININRTGSYTNNSVEAVSVCLEEFTFFASRVGNPVTPFVAKVNGENDFTVIAIGQTRTPQDYATGTNTFNFSDHSNDAVVLQPGESIAPGFMDAYPDGSGSVPGNSLIPAVTAGITDDVWQSYQGNANSDPHLVMGSIPQGNTIAQHLARSYQFNISINISAIEGEIIPEPVVTLFQHGYYTGFSWELVVGEYTDLALNRITDNAISSIKVDQGYIAELYSEKNFGGDMLLLDESSPFLGPDGFNDRVSSIKIYEFVAPPEPAVATLFQDSEYGGTAWGLPIGEYADLSLQGIAMNEVGSLQVEEGHLVELYPDIDFGGTPVAITSDTADLAAMGANDDAESARVTLHVPVIEVVATLFQHGWYGGTAWGLGAGDHPDVSLAGINENDASSLQVDQGYIVELYSEKDFGGDMLLLDESSPFLGPDSFNDRVSSIKIYEFVAPPEPAVATLFQDSEYGGTAWGLPIGEYADLSLQGIAMNEVGSLQVEEGHLVELYPDIDFGGTPVAITSDTADLAAMGANDDAESARVTLHVPVIEVVATLFQHGWYGGTAWGLGAGDHPDVSLAGINENDASSLQVDQGYIVELYSEKNFGGDMLLLDESSPFLGPDGFNDRVSSIKIYEFVAPPEPAVATLFQDSEYGGTAWGLDVGEYADISLENIPLNEVGSVQLEAGYVVELYPDLNFGGTPVILTSDTNDLLALGIDDDTESVKVSLEVVTPVATLFQNGWYGGTSWELGVGEYSDITLEGINDNDASSLQVDQGFIIELYSEKDFGGNVLILEESTVFLGYSDFNDKVSSVKVYQFVQAPLVPVVTLFQHGNYAGMAWELSVGEYSDITLEGINNNDASSLQIEEGYVIELYSEKDFGGDTITLENNTPYLNNPNFNDKVSSAKIYAYSEPVLATFFQDNQFGGDSWGLPLGEYTDITTEGIPLNQISSVQVVEGYAITLYPQLNFSGTPVVLTSDASELLTLGINDVIASIKVARDQCKCTSGEYSRLVNGSFEEINNPTYANAYDLIEGIGSSFGNVKFIDAHPDEEVPGWFTTGGIALQQGGFSQGGTLELGQSGFLGRQAADGNVFVEMDANHHHQIISVTPGEVLDWELSHRGREGEDEITISAGPVGNQTVLAVATSSNMEWITHSGQYQVPANITEIQFTITPSGASNGDMDSSNLLDFVRLCPSNGTVTTPVSLKTRMGVALELSTSYSLYPNPVGDRFYIRTENLSPQNAMLYIYSVTGTMVKQQRVVMDLTRDIEVQATDLAVGLYSIVIVGDTGETTTLQMLKK